MNNSSDPKTISNSDSDISLTDAFSIYQKHGDSVHKLWAYFQVVSLAVLGYTIGSDKTDWSAMTYLLVMASYLVFALCNQYVVYLSQRELNRFGEAVSTASKASGPIGQQLTIQSVAAHKMRLFHIIATLAVLVAISLTWYDKCAAPKQCPKPATDASTQRAQ